MTEPSTEQQLVLEGRCLGCAALLPDERGANRLYCDRRCQRGYKRVQRATERAAEPARVCAYRECRRGLDGRRSNVIYCDDRCKDRERRARERDLAAYSPKPKPANHGKPQPGRRKHQPGDRWGSLVLVEYLTDGEALFQCDCGSEVVKRLRNVATDKHPKPTRDCSDRAMHPDMRKVEDPTVGTWHHRLAAKYGSATTLPCSMCGEVTNGNVWAYRHSSGEARSQLTGRDRGQIYALEDEAYWVLCRSHHARWDIKASEVIPRGTLSLPYVALALAYDPVGYDPT